MKSKIINRVRERQMRVTEKTAQRQLIDIQRQIIDQQLKIATENYERNRQNDGTAIVNIT